MRRLLLISYFFPPLAGPGVFRPLRLAKSLPARGWEVSVLTVGKHARVLKDVTLLGDVPRETRVERTLSLEPRMPLLLLRKLGLRKVADRIEPLFFLPDDQRGWVPFATRRALRLLKRVEHHAVLSTSAPYSAHLVGLRLKQRLGIPWIADFRDEWTTNPYIRYPTAWHQRLNERLEREVLGAADRVVSVSEPWLENLAAQSPGEPPEKYRVHPNGYDRDHYTAPGPLPERFRIVYAGSFYGPRSPAVFLRALESVVASGRIPADEIEVVFIGHTGQAHGFDAPPGCNLRIVEQQPYTEALAYLRRAAVLLLVIPPEGGPGNHTGKLFNYLATGRPILCLAPRPNVAADLIRESRSGRVAPADDPRGIEQALVELYRDWKAGRSLPDQDREQIAGYEASPQAARWAEMLDELVDVASINADRRPAGAVREPARHGRR